MKNLLELIFAAILCSTFTLKAAAEDITADIFENGKKVGTVTMDETKFPAYAAGLQKKGMKAVAQAPKAGGADENAHKARLKDQQDAANAKHEEFKKSAEERKLANQALHEQWKENAASNN